MKIQISGFLLSMVFLGSFSCIPGPAPGPVPIDPNAANQPPKAITVSQNGGTYTSDIQLLVLNLNDLKTKLTGYSRLTYTADGSIPLYTSPLFPDTGLAVSTDGTIKITAWKSDQSALLSWSGTFVFQLTTIPRAYWGNYVYSSLFRLVVTGASVKVEQLSSGHWIAFDGPYPVTLTSATSFSLPTNYFNGRDWTFKEGGTYLQFTTGTDTLNLAFRGSPIDSRTHLKVVGLTQTAAGAARGLALTGLQGIQVLVKNLKNEYDAGVFTTNPQGEIVATGLPGGDDYLVTPVPDPAGPSLSSTPAVITVPERVADFDAGILTQLQTSTSGNLQVIFYPDSYTDWINPQLGRYIMAGTTNQGFSFTVKNIGQGPTGNLTVQAVAPAGVAVRSLTPTAHGALAAGFSDVFSLFLDFSVQPEAWVDRQIKILITDSNLPAGSPPIEGSITLRVYRSTFQVNTTWVTKLLLRAPTGELYQGGFNLGQQNLIFPYVPGVWKGIITSSDGQTRVYSLGLGTAAMPLGIQQLTGLDLAFEPNNSFAETKSLPFPGAIAAQVSGQDADFYQFTLPDAEPLPPPTRDLSPTTVPGPNPAASFVPTTSNFLDLSTNNPVIASVYSSTNGRGLVVYKETTLGQWTSSSYGQYSPTQNFDAFVTGADGKTYLYYMALDGATQYYAVNLATWKDGIFDFSVPQSTLYNKVGFLHRSATWETAQAYLYHGSNIYGEQYRLYRSWWDGAAWQTVSFGPVGTTGLDLWPQASGQWAIATKPNVAGYSTAMIKQNATGGWDTPVALTGVNDEFESGAMTASGDPIFSFVPQNQNPTYLGVKKGTGLIAVLPAQLTFATWESALGRIYVLGRWESNNVGVLRLFEIGANSYRYRELSGPIAGTSYSAGVGPDGRINAVWLAGTVLKELTVDPLSLLP